MLCRTMFALRCCIVAMSIAMPSTHAVRARQFVLRAMRQFGGFEQRLRRDAALQAGAAERGPAVTVRHPSIQALESPFCAARIAAR